MSKQEEKKDDGLQCPNCHNWLIYGTTDINGGKLCSHCLTIFGVKKSNASQ